MRKTYRFSELDAAVHGRHEYTDSGALALSWSASGFEMNFSAERVIIKFVPDYCDDQPCYIALELDGERRQKFAVSTGAEVVMLEDIPAGVHRLSVVKLSEGAFPLKFETLELVGGDCSILPPPEYSLRFEFLGDSITCGFGDIAEPTSPAFLTSEEDATRTYAYLTSRHFGAEIRVEAISGQGIVKNCNGDEGTRIPCFFERELVSSRAPHDFSEWVPQLVVINAGTNDNGGRVSDEDFADGADRFLSRIREVYPKAQIVWLYGMMGLRYDKTLEKVVAEKNDPRIHYLRVEPVSAASGETGTYSHPNEKGQLRAARELIKLVEKLI